MKISHVHLAAPLAPVSLLPEDADELTEPAPPILPVPVVVALDAVVAATAAAVVEAGAGPATIVPSGPAISRVAAASSAVTAAPSGNAVRTAPLAEPRPIASEAAVRPEVLVDRMVEFRRIDVMAASASPAFALETLAAEAQTTPQQAGASSGHEQGSEQGSDQDDLAGLSDIGLPGDAAQFVQLTGPPLMNRRLDTNGVDDALLLSQALRMARAGIVDPASGPAAMVAPVVEPAALAPQLPPLWALPEVGNRADNAKDAGAGIALRAFVRWRLPIGRARRRAPLKAPVPLAYPRQFARPQDAAATSKSDQRPDRAAERAIVPTAGYERRLHCARAAAVSLTTSRKSRAATHSVSLSISSKSMIFTIGSSSLYSAHHSTR